MNTWLVVLAFCLFNSRVSPQQVGEMAKRIQKWTK